MTNAASHEAGDLIGTFRNIEVSQIPLAISLELAKRYRGYILSTHAWELNFDGQTSYYLNVENDKQQVSLKCASNGELSVESKIKKN